MVDLVYTEVEPKALLETEILQVALDFSIIRVGTSTSLRVLVGRLVLDDSLLLDGGLVGIIAVVTVTGNLALLDGLALGALGLGSSLLSRGLDSRGVGRGDSAVACGSSVEVEELLLGDAQHLASRGGGLGAGEARELFVVNLWKGEQTCQLGIASRLKKS